MGRIRTIKPEFPQSESIGSLSRDARLLYIQLWTLADDEGRLRGASRMLASLLYPYDEDAPDLINGWMEQLDNGKHVIRYKVGEHSYVQILNFLEHQKIDRPSKSKLPAFASPREDSPKPLEPSSPYQGSSIKDQGGDQGVERAGANPPEPPTLDPLETEAEEIPEGLTPMQYAKGILERASIPSGFKLDVKTSDTIEFLARDEGCALNVAAGRLLERIKSRRDTRSLWFWLEDGGWKQAQAFSLGMEDDSEA